MALGSRGLVVRPGYRFGDQRARQSRPRAFPIARPRRYRQAVIRVGAKQKPGERIRGSMEFSKLFPSLPNLITVARLLLAPLAVLMIASQRYVEAFLIFRHRGHIGRRRRLYRQTIQPDDGTRRLSRSVGRQGAAGLDLCDSGDFRRFAGGDRHSRRLSRSDDSERRRRFLAARQSCGDPARPRVED